VYADLGGVLVVNADGEILRFDPETDKVSIVDDEGWRALALCRASRRSPELSQLKPPRPAKSVECPQCGGEGSVFGGIECGKCFGLGWLQMPVG
jgi:DnaJ-class molecular chaperone